MVAMVAEALTLLATLVVVEVAVKLVEVEEEVEEGVEVAGSSSRAHLAWRSSACLGPTRMLVQN